VGFEQVCLSIFSHTTVNKIFLNGMAVTNQKAHITLEYGTLFKS